LTVYRQLRDRAVLVPVTVAGEDGGSGTKAEAPKIVLHCGQGRRLEMPLSVSPQWLSSLLKGL